MRDLDARLFEAAKTFGTPSYVYFTDAIETRLAEIRAAFETWFDISYAVKCNPNPRLLEWLSKRVEFVDVSSIGEFRTARKMGWDAPRASFTGPGKREAELFEAIEAGIGELVVESPREARIANKIAAQLGVVQDILIRLAPTKVPKGFGDQMAGRPSQFGIDIEVADEELPEILALPHLRVTGLHIYSGTQCLKPEAICENYRIFISIFREVCAKHDIAPEKLIFGSGLGIPYHTGDTALDLSDVADRIGADLDALQGEARFRDTKFVLELGRYLVGEAGYFLTRVIGLKHSRGRLIGICDGGMNNHLPASGHFGMVIHRNYRMHKVGGGDGEEKVDLVGPLCTSIDRVASGVMLPSLTEGDLIGVHSSGAYGLTASPFDFISHPHPVEILIEGSELTDVSRHKGERL